MCFKNKQGRHPLLLSCSTPAHWYAIYQTNLNTNTILVFPLTLVTLQQLYFSSQSQYDILSINMCRDGEVAQHQRVCDLMVFFGDTRYLSVTNFLQPVVEKSCHVLSCLCDNACKSSLAICLKSRELCSINRFLSVPVQPA